MRINVYSEELTQRIEVIERMPSSGHTGQTFFGLRFYLSSPPELKMQADDDDTSAVTIWFADRDHLTRWIEDLRRAGAGINPLEYAAGVAALREGAR